MVNDQQKSFLLGYSQADGAIVHLPTQSWWKIRHSVVLKINKHNAEERRVDGLYV